MTMISDRVRTGLVSAVREEIEAGTTDTRAKLDASVDFMIEDALSSSKPAPASPTKLRVPICIGCGIPKILSGGRTGEYRCHNPTCVINLHHGSCESGL